MHVINILVGLKHIMRICQLFIQHIGLASCQQLQHATSYEQVLLIRVPLRCSLLQGCIINQMFVDTRWIYGCMLSL